jgi:transporter family protein
MQSWEVLCASGVLFWGIWSWTLKIALKHDNDFPAVTLATSLGIFAIAGCAYLAFATPLQLPATVSVWLLLLVSGITGGAGQVFLAQALERGPVAVVVPMYAMAPMITVVLSILFLHDGFTGRQAIGVALAVISTIILSLKERPDE